MDELNGPRGRKSHAGRTLDYHQLPAMVRVFDEMQQELLKISTSDPSFPTEELRQRLNAISAELIQTLFPELWLDIQTGARECRMEEGDFARVIIVEVICPVLLAAVEKELNSSLREISQLCCDGIDQELEILKAS